MSLKIDGCIVAGSVVTIQLNRAADSRGERAYQARLFVAVPEMYELITTGVRFLQNVRQYHPLSAAEEKWEQNARELMAKIDGGGE